MHATKMPESVEPPRSKRRLLWYAVAIVAMPLGYLVSQLLPQPAGPHAESHLFGAVAYGVQAVIIAAVALMVRDRLAKVARVALLVPVAGLMVGVVANFYTLPAIWNKTWDHDDAGELGSSVAGFETGHHIAAYGDWIITAGALAFAIAVLVSRRAGKRGPIAAIVLCIIPPFAFPALSCSFLLAHLASRQTDSRDTMNEQAPLVPIATPA